VSTWKKTNELKTTACETIAPYQETGRAHFSMTMEKFHVMRRERPWEMVGAIALGCSLIALPCGRGAAIRMGILSGLISTCVVNPEYVVDLYKNSKISSSKY
jgi:hypothetical protein